MKDFSDCADFEKSFQGHGLKKLGTLRVTVGKATKLDVLRKAPNSYVELVLGQQTRLTSVIRDSADPEWNEEVTFDIFEVFIRPDLDPLF